MSLTIQSGGSITLQGGAGGGGAITLVQNATTTAFNDITSATFTDGSTVVSVSMTTGTRALVTLTTYCQVYTGTGTIFCGFAVSGATTLAAADERSVLWRNTDNINGVQPSATVSNTLLLSNLNAGTNTFKLQYKVGSGVTTARFYRPTITVMALA